MTAIPWAEVVAAAGVVQEVTLEEFTGRGPHGDVYAAAVTVSPVVVTDTRRRARTGSGDLVSSSRTVYCPPDTSGVTGSRVTFAGVTATVLQRTLHTGAGAETPDHVELMLE